MPPAKPHSRTKAAARDKAAVDPDAAWAAELYKRMLADCHPFQRGAVEDPGKRVSIIAGRGGGKTTVLRVRAMRKTTAIRRARIAYVATSRPEAERLNWEPLKELIDQLGEMDHFDFAEQKMRLTCRRTGATYQFFGADDKREINKLRGQPFNEFQVDECASHDPVLLENMLDRAVGPRLGERDGCIVIAGTPGHILYGTFYDATHDGSDFHRPYAKRNQAEYAGFLGWSSHAWDLFDVMALPNAKKRYPAMAKNYADALEQKARKKWSDDNPVWLREYRRRWALDNTTSMYAYRAKLDDGAPFNQWDPLGWSAVQWEEYQAMESFEEQRLRAVEMLKLAIAKLPADVRRDALYGYGMDLGSKDPHALDVFAFSPTDPRRRKYHVCSFDRRKTYARLLSELLIGPEATAIAARGEVFQEVGGLFGVTDWPPAIVADLAALGEAVVNELKNVYGVPVKAAEKKDKLSAIEVLNGDLVDGLVYILAGSELEKQLSTLQWKPDENGMPKEDRSARNDHADAATYIRTELGRMFGGAGAPDEVDEASAADDRKANPKAKVAKQPAKPADPWDDEPSRSRRRGEFDSLLQHDDFSGLK